MEDLLQNLVANETTWYTFPHTETLSQSHVLSDEVTRQLSEGGWEVFRPTGDKMVYVGNTQR